MLSQPLQAWQDSGEFISFKGYQVFYRDGGAGVPLLMIHGFPSASFDWKAVWPLLSDDFRLITADMLGFGFSDKPKAFNYSIMAQADLYESLMRHLKIESAHILAHDYGDTVAQELLARHLNGQLSFDICSVTLLNGGLFPETHRPLLIQKLLMSPVGWVLAKLMGRKKFAQNLQKICSESMTEQEIDWLWELLLLNDGRAVVPKLIYYMQERRVHRSRWVGALEQANAIALPIHLIDGVIDPISGAHLVARFQALIPDAKVTELQGIGHYPQVEAPEAVVHAFLEGLRDASSEVSSMEYQPA